MVMAPLTKKGAKIREAMEKFYGEKKGDEVFYASINKGKINAEIRTFNPLIPKTRSSLQIKLKACKIINKIRGKIQFRFSINRTLNA